MHLLRTITLKAVYLLGQLHRTVHHHHHHHQPLLLVNQAVMKDSSASVASPPQQRYRVRVRGGRTGIHGRGAVNNRRQNAGVCGAVRGRGQRRGAPGNRQQNFDYNFVWDDNARPFRVFPFTGNPGVKVNIDDSTCALSIFKTFLTDEMVDDIYSYLYKCICSALERSSRHSTSN